MRGVAKALVVVGLAMVGVIIWRVITGGPIGPRTYSGIAATAVVLIAAVILWRRDGSPAGAPPPPR